MINEFLGDRKLYYSPAKIVFCMYTRLQYTEIAFTILHNLVVIALVSSCPLCPVCEYEIVCNVKTKKNYNCLQHMTEEVFHIICIQLYLLL